MYIIIVYTLYAVLHSTIHTFVIHLIFTFIKYSVNIYIAGFLFNPLRKTLVWVQCLPTGDRRPAKFLASVTILSAVDGLSDYHRFIIR